MADSKYINLPYIAAGEPDVYETGDLPEADQALLEKPVQEEEVETLAVDPKVAFKRFNAASIDANRVNFTENGGYPGRAGYSVHYEILPHSELSEETVVQRLQRLKYELKELGDLAKSRFDDPGKSPVSLLKEIEDLQKQLDQFSFPSVASRDNDLQKYYQLLSQLKCASPANQNKTQLQPSVSTSVVKEGAAVFELNYFPDSVNITKEAHLDARIAFVEKLLGNKGDDKSDCLGGQSLIEAVATISSKMHLLEEDKIDKISARLQVLLQSLTKVNESSTTENARNMEKVNELYDLIKKWDEYADMLPSIVDRLYSLQDLHQHAMEFSSSLKALETAQAELGQNMSNYSQLVADVQKTFSSNVDTIKANIESLEKRIGALNK